MNYSKYINMVFYMLSSAYASVYVTLITENDPMQTEIKCIDKGKGYSIKVQTPIPDLMIGDVDVAARKTALETIIMLQNKRRLQ